MPVATDLADGSLDLDHSRRPHRGRAGRPRLRPARGAGGRARRVRRHRTAPSPPPGPDPGPAGGRLLRRSGPGQLCRPSAARGGQIRRHGHPDDGRLDPRLPAPRVPGRGQAVPAHRPDRAAHALRRRRLADGEPAGRLGVAAGPVQGPGGGARDRRGVGRAVPPPAPGPGSRLRPGHPLAGRARVVLPVRRDSGSAACHRRGQGGHGATPAHGPAGLRGRGLRQDRGGHPGGVQGGPGRVPGGRPGAHHPAGQPARPDVRRPVRAVSGAGGDAQRGS